MEMLKIGKHSKRLLKRVSDYNVAFQSKHQIILSAGVVIIKISLNFFRIILQSCFLIFIIEPNFFLIQLKQIDPKNVCMDNFL